MIDFIIKYWVQWAFGVLALLIGFGAKHTIKVYKDYFIQKDKERAADLRNDVKKEIVREVDKKIENLAKVNKQQNADIEALYNAQENLTMGVLSLQGKQYRDFCRTLLMSEHEITIDEYEQEEDDYQAYKGLGGNHKGDTLHASVVKKYEAQLAARVQEKLEK